MTCSPPPWLYCYTVIALTTTQSIGWTDEFGIVESRPRGRLRYAEAMDPEEIKQLIEEGLPGAKVEVRDTTGGGDHFEAIVVTEAFEGKGLVERHQAVYSTLGDAMRERVHALSLTTLTPAQFSKRR
jgi:acid stress-induced BolA-like protein IbaG/YrbA